MTSSSPYTPITTSSTTTTTTTPTPLSTNIDFISRAKHRLYGTLSTRRPWSQFLDHHSISFPRPIVSESISRLKTIPSYFRMNFAMILLLILFLSLLWHPFSLIVFLIMMVAWLFLFFLRDDPLVVFGRPIDDRFILVALSVLTVGFLLFTGATRNIFIALAVGAAFVFLYSVFRRSDDLFLDEDDAAAGGLLASRV